MKKLVLALIVSVVFFAGSASDAKAQQKIGYINSNELLMLMPERDSALSVLETKRQDFIKQSEELEVELNRQYDAYLQQRDSLSDLIRQTKEAALNDLQGRIQTFGTAADQELQKLQGELFQPIIDKAQKAIKEVAVEMDYTYVLDTGTGAVIYFPEGALNLLEPVKKKLGIL
ncbi:MAG: OmpH family outer membrane protein [Bacteroidetes bacterium]|jgi:outer membrane protein|nr:OmpH family outer membrane protein [Bacteroidota bacterium]MBT3751635.1 OmpH family outer membrane protein [Bacteroidota bacterium]MBT4399466.1 OmpH family outer membrane protein [Bacteroidota bacterium]MBT4409994.1 OmpH family outer membrane protein [Bacteroidota bacterium]MBT5426275.1 OmpH family outer membrane protein [Bacteroidota bacterium]